MTKVVSCDMNSDFRGIIVENCLYNLSFYFGECLGNSEVGPKEAIDQPPLIKGTWIGWLVCKHNVALRGQCGPCLRQ